MRQVPDLKAEVDTDRRQYTPQRAVEIYTRLTNTGRFNKVIPLRGSFEYDLLARDDRSGKVVWTWSKGRRPGGGTIRLGPGESLRRSELWDKRGDDGQRVPEGVYRIEAYLFPLNQPAVTRIFLQGRGDRDDPRPAPGPGPVPGPTRPGGLTARLEADRRSVKSGEAIRFTYTVVNSGSTPRTLQFRSGQRFEIEVARRPEPNARYARGALTLWKLSQGMAFTMALGSQTFAPGESKTFTASWLVPQGVVSCDADVRAWLTGGETFEVTESASASVALHVN